ncbi:hypothetical protein Pmani_025659 [Petrolisthes manimaculis]|uniref:Uncharacterized protein n=1 Tax=Petrolisthes manimaculis TaxID=1843537 RepID=A0AAE1U0Z2_9EUCA|nr:hypothetical protein Pmani_025659 [Petrolisthes manimaculis]
MRVPIPNTPGPAHLFSRFLHPPGHHRMHIPTSPSNPPPPPPGIYLPHPPPPGTYLPHPPTHHHHHQAPTYLTLQPSNTRHLPTSPSNPPSPGTYLPHPPTLHHHPPPPPSSSPFRPPSAHPNPHLACEITLQMTRFCNE